MMIDLGTSSKTVTLSPGLRLEDGLCGGKGVGGKSIVLSHDW